MTYFKSNAFIENPEDQLFSELNCNKTFDDMIQTCYDTHPANIFLVMKNCDFYENSYLAPESKIEDPHINQCNYEFIFPINYDTPLGSNSLSCNKNFLIQNSRDDDEKKHTQICKVNQCCNYRYNLRSCGSKHSKSALINSNCSKNSDQDQNMYQAMILEPVFKITKHQRRARFINIPEYKRWGRKEDIQLFKLLRKELSIKKINEDEFLNAYIEDILDHDYQRIKDPIYDSIISQLAVDTNWLRTPYHLLQRVYNLVMNQRLSIREDALMTKILLSESKPDQIDFLKIASFFPGKSVSSIKDKVYSFFMKDE